LSLPGLSVSDKFGGVEADTYLLRDDFGRNGRVWRKIKVALRAGAQSLWSFSSEAITSTTWVRRVLSLASSASSLRQVKKFAGCEAARTAFVMNAAISSARN
jgi:hypothetical protein